MDGYTKPIFNPNKMTVSAPHKENTVENVKRLEISDKVDIKDSATVGETHKTDEELLEEVVTAAAENAEENEDIEHIRDLQHKEYEDRELETLTPDDAIPLPDLPDGVIAVERTFPTDASGKPIFTKEGRESAPAADVDILHVDDLDKINDAAFEEGFKKVATAHEISDEDAVALLDLLMAYKKDKSISVYNKMPSGIKDQVKQICLTTGIPLSNANMVAKAMLEEMISETATDQTFIDFEKSIAAAMKIPSLIDIYEEHISETVSEKLPKMADAIREEDPEKAEMLMSIAKRYDASRDFSEMRAVYDSTSRIRKLIRRDFGKWRRFAEELNLMNKNTRFRMADATSLYPILIKVIANDIDSDIDEIGVQKFMVLLCSSCFNLKKDDLVDASYIYYLLKNISMLGYVNDDSSKGADSFSVELISNIKSIIYYIIACEDAFYKSQMSK